MGLKLKRGPKDRLWVNAVILVPEDHGEVGEDRFEVQFRYLNQTERRRAANEMAAVIRNAMPNGKDFPEPDLGDEAFDPGSDLALRWLVEKGCITGFRGLLTEDDAEVQVSDLPELLDIPCYRVGFWELFRAQLQNPTAADEKN